MPSPRLRGRVPRARRAGVAAPSGSACRRRRASSRRCGQLEACTPTATRRSPATMPAVPGRRRAWRCASTSSRAARRRRRLDARCRHPELRRLGRRRPRRRRASSYASASASLAAPARLPRASSASAGATPRGTVVRARQATHRAPARSPTCGPTCSSRRGRRARRRRRRPDLRALRRQRGQRARPAPFDVALALDGAAPCTASDPVGLAAGAARAGRRSRRRAARPATASRVTADAAALVDEADEDDNVLARRCAVR